MSSRWTLNCEQSSRDALAEIKYYRAEAQRRLALDQYDPEPLRLVETYSRNCIEALMDGELGLLLAWHTQLVKALEWSRIPVLHSNRQREVARQPRSGTKQRALQLYRDADPRPGSAMEFMYLLEVAGVACSMDQARHWYTEARRNLTQ